MDHRILTIPPRMIRSICVQKAVHHNTSLLKVLLKKRDNLDVTHRGAKIPSDITTAMIVIRRRGNRNTAVDTSSVSVREGTG